MSKEPPSYLLCPISMTLMKNPVICTIDGMTYEKEAIVAWIEKTGRSIFTRQLITIESLVPNRTLLYVIDGWKLQSQDSELVTKNHVHLLCDPEVERLSKMKKIIQHLSFYQCPRWLNMRKELDIRREDRAKELKKILLEQLDPLLHDFTRFINLKLQINNILVNHQYPSLFPSQIFIKQLSEQADSRRDYYRIEKQDFANDVFYEKMLNDFKQMLLKLDDFCFLSFLSKSGSIEREFGDDFIFIVNICIEERLDKFNIEIEKERLSFLVKQMRNDLVDSIMNK